MIQYKVITKRRKNYTVTEEYRVIDHNNLCDIFFMLGPNAVSIYISKIKEKTLCPYRLEDNHFHPEFHLFFMKNMDMIKEEDDPFIGKLFYIERENFLNKLLPQMKNIK